MEMQTTTDSTSSALFYSRKLFFSEHGGGDDGYDDDGYDDDGGYLNYVPTAIDPGPKIVFMTIFVQFLLVFSLPCLLILAKRFDRRRARKQEDELLNGDHGGDGGMVEIPLDDEKGVEMGELKAITHPNDFLLTNTRSEVSSTNTGDHFDLESNVTNTSSFVRNGNSIIKSIENTKRNKLPVANHDVDAVSMFSYGSRSIVSHTSQMSAYSAASCRSTILDARARKRRKGLMNQNGMERARRIRKHVEQESVLQRYENMPRVVSGREGWTDTMSDIGGVQALRNTIRQRGRSAHKKHERSNKSGSPERSVMSRSVLSKADDTISPNDAVDASDPGRLPAACEMEEEDLQVCCGKNALWRPKIIRRAFGKLSEIADFDHESKRIIKLSIPFTVSEILDGVFEVVEMALVGRIIGTDALAAYVVVELLIGTSGEFIDGIVDAQLTVAMHAIGAGNNYLAGQYTQISATLYFIANIPFIIMWYIITKPVVLWLGMSQNVADIGQGYANVALIVGLIDGLFGCYEGLLEITNHEVYCMVVGIIGSILEVLAVAGAMLGRKISLVEFAWINFAISSSYSLAVFAHTTHKKWLKSFWPGMFKNFALKDYQPVKYMLSTAVPLSLGNLLAYAEWEVLTFYAAHMGSAEVTTWAVLGNIWEVFEASTNGLGDAAEVRCAYHLGKGRPEMARMSSYKSILLGGLFGILVTSIFLIMGEDLPAWFTEDPTIQQLLTDVIPLVGLGNISMTFGMVCWTLIGAQGRYRLATFVNLICSWGVAMPLGAFLVYVMNYNLKGLTSAVVISYTVLGIAMTFILMRSDWQKLSDKIVEINRMTGEIDSDSDADEEDEESESSGSSASSDDDDSSDESSDSSDSSKDGESSDDSKAKKR